MRGRCDQRFQPENRRRYRGSRMLRAPYRTNSQVGMIPEVGAYLDLPPGQLADPESVLKWLECLRIYMYINYESRIKEIIGYDGVLKEYPKIEAPENPDADAGVVEMTLWELALEEYEDARESLERDRLKLHILLLGQMSEGSRNRIEQSTAGEKALKEGDPLGLLSAVIATHVINSGFGATYDVVTAETNLYTIKMLPKEDLGRYFDRFGRMLYVKSVAYRMAGVKMQKDSDGLLAVMFIIKLNHHYSGYINNFMNKLRDWPTTLSEAYQDAANYWTMKDTHRKLMRHRVTDKVDLRLFLMTRTNGTINNWIELETKDQVMRV